MAAPALRFLAHCFEMTPLVSLSTRAGRRGSLSSFFPALSPAALFFLSHLALALCQAFFHESFSLCVLGAGSSRVTASLELLEWGMGESEEGGGEVGREGGGK